ncbi:transporter associated domain-containing protein, partial [Paracoccus benzoatiresistens]
VRALMARAHTRYPVIDDDDAPVGVVHLADVLAHAASEQGEATVASVMRPPAVIPTLMSLPVALSQLASTRNQLACVIDEYGGFAGVLTLEDLAMEIVGEITDEHDDDAGDGLTPEGEDVWLIDGDVHLDELRRAISRDLPQPDVETVAGLLIAERGALPAEGERVTIPLPIDPAELVDRDPIRWLLEVDVLRVERHIPSLLRVRLVSADHTEDNT